MITGPPTGQRRRAVTLLEVVLAMSLLTVVSSLTYWFYFSSVSAREQGLEEARKLRLARVVLDRISDEIRQAAAVTRDYGVGIIGRQEEIMVTTYRVPRRELAQPDPSGESPSPQYDLVQIQYKTARHPDILHEDGYKASLGLARVEQLIPRPETPLDSAGDGAADAAAEGEGAPPDETQLTDALLDELFGSVESEENASAGPDINWEELYSPDIHILRFCYYDGYSWWDDWTIFGDNPLPQLIQVTIGFGERAPVGEEQGVERINEEFCTCMNQDPVECRPLLPDQFTAVVRVPGADPLFRSRVAREGQALVEEKAKEKDKTP